MLPRVHVQMMRAALSGLVAERPLRRMIDANLRVDAVWHQFGRHELHFDENAFEGSYALIADQRARIRPALEVGSPEVAWRAFGRLTHTAQDFYSHTNYVDLWISSRPSGRLPPPGAIDPLDKALLNSAALRSGKAYLPWGLLSFLPVAGPWLSRLMPEDSHARMNLDSPARGPRFEYAFQAAVKRTRAEYLEATGTLAEHLRVLFGGRGRPSS